jgi:hypothetical protein
LECKLNKNRINQAEIKQFKENVNLFLNKHQKFKQANIKICFAIFDEKELVKFEIFS